MPHYAVLDLSRIRAKIADIKECLQILREYASRPDQDFLDNPEAVRAARYTLIVAIEAATNIGNHFCSRVLGKAPTSYAETFRVLGDGQVISQKLANNLAKMTGLRNLLVHQYSDIDNRKLLQIMRTDLGDLEKFIAELRPYFAKGNGKVKPIMLKRFSHSQKERNKIKKTLWAYLAKQPEVLFAYLHGSFLGQIPYADIDVAVYFRPTISDWEQLELVLKYAAELSCLAGLTVDVQSLNNASLEFQFQATRGEVLFSRDEERRYAFLETLWPQYFDFQYFLNLPTDKSGGF